MSEEQAFVVSRKDNDKRQQKTPSENTENQNNQHQQPLALLSPKTGTASSSPTP
jgi:hypothetical protein